MESFERTINYVFKDQALLLESLSYGGQANLKSNQRLELIGDGVLGGLFSSSKCLSGYLNLCFSIRSTCRRKASYGFSRLYSWND